MSHLINAIMYVRKWTVMVHCFPQGVASSIGAAPVLNVSQRRPTALYKSWRAGQMMARFLYDYRSDQRTHTEQADCCLL